MIVGLVYSVSCVALIQSFDKFKEKYLEQFNKLHK